MQRNLVKWLVYDRVLYFVYWLLESKTLTRAARVSNQQSLDIHRSAKSIGVFTR
jgi:hypothetical protein